MTDFQLFQATVQAGLIAFFFHMQIKDAMDKPVFIFMMLTFAVAGLFDLIIPSLVYIFNFVLTLVS